MGEKERREKRYGESKWVYETQQQKRWLEMEWNVSSIIDWISFSTSLLLQRLSILSHLFLSLFCLLICCLCVYFCFVFNRTSPSFSISSKSSFSVWFRLASHASLPNVSLNHSSLASRSLLPSYDRLKKETNRWLLSPRLMHIFPIGDQRAWLQVVLLPCSCYHHYYC